MCLFLHQYTLSNNSTVSILKSYLYEIMPPIWGSNLEPLVYPANGLPLSCSVTWMDVIHANSLWHKPYLAIALSSRYKL